TRHNPQPAGPPPIRMGIGNTAPYVVNYYLLDDKCQEQQIGALTPGPSSFVDTWPGAVYYARATNEFRDVISTFTVRDGNNTWIIREEIPIPSVRPSPSSTPSSTSGGSSNAPGATTSNGSNSGATGSASGTNSGGSRGPNVGAIVGGVIGGLIGLAVIVGAVFFVRRRSAGGAAAGKATSEEDGEASAAAVGTPVLSPGGIYKVINPHTSQLNDELTVQVGDQVQVHALYDDGWVLGSKKGTGSQGMLPAGCLDAAPVQSGTQPSLRRPRPTS
ncbi:hypothetical protein HK102_008934, partial [Quaeritorhiza haematococci]